MYALYCWMVGDVVNKYKVKLHLNTQRKLYINVQYNS